jgi:Sulfotransferase domain
VRHHRVKRRLQRSFVRRIIVRVRHRRLRDEDVFIASYPRSGNTWLRFLLAELFSESETDFQSIDSLIPYVGKHLNAPPLLPNGGRLIKTHEPYRREYRKAVYVIRDVRDVVVSYQRWIPGYGARYESMDRLVVDFMRGTTDGVGPWAYNVSSWTTARDPSADVLTVRFEDVKGDTEGSLAEIVQFLGVEPNRERIKRAVERNSLDYMKKMEQQNRDYIASELKFKGTGTRGTEHVHSGSVGGWRSVLRPEHIEMLRPALQVMSSVGYRVD